nr:uncharacterized protein LOC111993087 [Quercus suber]
MASQPSATPLMGRRVNHRTRWQPPPADLMKINFDGAVFSSVNAAGIGVVIRNNLGQVIASCSQRLSQAYSSNEVEALAAAKAVSFAVEIGITKAVLEGDSLTIMKALSSDHSSLAPFGLMIDDVKFSAENFDQLLYSHVKRDYEDCVERALLLKAKIGVQWRFKESASSFQYATLNGETLLSVSM